MQLIIGEVQHNLNLSHYLRRLAKSTHSQSRRITEKVLRLFYSTIILAFKSKAQAETTHSSLIYVLTCR